MRAEGLPATLRRLVEIVREVMLLTEEHVWYVFDLRPLADSEAPRGDEIVRATEDQLPLVAQVGHSVTDAKVRYADGVADLWVSLRDGGLLFSCWIYSDRVPVLAAPRGWLDLPETVLWQEDTVVTSEARGLGIGVVIGATLYCRLAAEGQTTVLTKIPVANEHARKAAAKVGFAELATVRLTRRLGHRSVLFTPAPGPHIELAQQLGRQLEP